MTAFVVHVNKNKLKLVKCQMDSLITVINKLQNIFHIIGEETFPLPQIVAVGDQSSGKSSVIESIIGKSFLPKGVGIVTRQPLILQLVNIQPEEKNLAEEFGVFKHKKNVIFKDFESIRMEIETITNTKVGRNKEISEEPISLSIYSRNVVNLTLIDLPGLTKIPVGNQPPDIEIRIRKLIAKYISNPNSIILAVVTANTDMTTSESLKLAREFDRDGSRTVAVVTKLDLMDAGTNATDILTGKIVPVRLGIIGVVNRSQKDTFTNKSISDAIEDEKIFLQKHYPSIADKQGTPYLSQTLNDILKLHIQKCLPDLKLRINNVKAQTISKLHLYGADVLNSSKALLNIVTSFSSSFCAALDGTSRQIETTKLSGGARICYIFHESFGKTLDYIQPLLGLSNFDILTAMRNSSGARPALFVPETCFETLVKRQIARLLEPSLKCVKLIHDEMQQILESSCGKTQFEAIRFPKLFEKISTITSNLISRELDSSITAIKTLKLTFGVIHFILLLSTEGRLTVTNSMVENLIDIELAYINTMHPEFRKNADNSFLFYFDEKIHENEKLENENVKFRTVSSGGQSLSSESPDLLSPNVLSLGWFTSFFPVNYISRFPGSIIPYSLQLRTPRGSQTQMTAIQTLSERDKLECEAVEKLVSSYFNIIKKSIQDKVPKVIMHFLVNFVKENIQRELVEVLYKTEQDESLFQEPEFIKCQREEQKYILSTLENVDSLLNEIRNMTI